MDFIMDKSEEELLYQAINENNDVKVSQILQKGANPNKTTRQGKTCLGLAASLGHLTVLKLLIEEIIENPRSIELDSKKRHDKSHKRKLSHDDHETMVKYKNLHERNAKDFFSTCPEIKKSETVQNQGYFEFIYSDASSSDESKVASNSPSSLTPTSGDFEWDEGLGGNYAPTTSEDDTWSSMYKWYASILECTGAALASASMVKGNLDQQDAYVRTALHYAAEQGHSAAVKLLLDSGSRVDVAGVDGLTPLHVTVINNNEEIVRMLLQSGSHVNCKTFEKMTPLHYAASHGYLNLVKILVTSGADLEARDTNERTALYIATGHCHLDIVKYLISVGANVNSEEIHGYTPLCEAVWKYSANIVEVLLSSGARVTHSHKLLHNAILELQEDMVKMLASTGRGLNLHNNNGDTPLLLAIRLGQPKLARILLENGANVNLCNSITGTSALHVAVETVKIPRVFEDVLICLLDYGIDMNVTALTGDTALNRALLLHRDTAAKLLIQHGANVNYRDLHSCGLDNLEIASRRCLPDMVAMLVLAGHYLPVPANTTWPTLGTGNVDYLDNLSKQPFSLTNLCRIKIRTICGKKVLHKYIYSLPLPNSLKQFLMIKDIDFIC